MDKKELAKKMINLNRKAFEDYFSTIVALQLQAENVINFFHYFPVISDEGKKFLEHRVFVYKKWIDDLKKAADEGFVKIETFIDNNASLIFRDYNDKVFNSFFNQMYRIPQDLKDNMLDLAEKYRVGCDEFNKYFNDSIRRMGYFYTTTETSHTDTKQKK